jgi:hypothetical protein
MKVPDDAVEGIANLHVTVAKDAYTRQLDRSIQVNGKDVEAKLPAVNLPAQQAQGLSNLHVQFYPEGGPLVAGVANEVTMWTEWDDNEPRELTGKVVDSQKRVVVDGIATTNGRAKFKFTPVADETYSFTCTDAPAARGVALPIETPLPAPQSNVHGKLTALATSYSPSQPLRFEIAATKTPAQFVVAASDGEQVVGQQYVDFDAAKQSGVVAQRVTVPLADDACGLLGVTLYDVESNPPQAIAQHFVYREEARKWNIELTPGETSGSADSAQWSIQVRDENGHGAKALLGVNVQRESDGAPATPYRRTELLAENNVRYMQESLSQRALDDLSATGATALNRSHMIQRFGSLSGSGTKGMDARSGRPVSGSGEALRGFGYAGFTANQNALAALNDFGNVTAPQLAPTPPPPQIVDNLSSVEAAYRESLAAWRGAQEQRWQGFALAIVVGSVVLICATLLLTTLRLADRYYMWLPSLSAGAVALLIGGVWLRVDLDRPITVAVRPLAAFRGETLLAGGVLPAGGGLGGGGLGGLGAEYTEGFGLQPRIADPLAEVPSDRPVAPETKPEAEVETLLREELAKRYYFSLPALHGAIDTASAAAQPDVNHWFAQRYLRHRYDTFGEAHDYELGLRRQPTPPQLMDDYVQIAPLALKIAGDATAPTARPTGSPQAESTTVYWNPLIETDSTGKAEIHFNPPPRYRIIIDASGSGRWGHAERVVNEEARAATSASPSTPADPPPPAP